jgi:hypothetical protein
MANPVSGITSAQQTEAITQTTPTPKQTGGNKGVGAPEDTVTISSAGSAASQTKAPTQNHKGGSHHGK